MTDLGRLYFRLNRAFLNKTKKNVLFKTAFFDQKHVFPITNTNQSLPFSHLLVIHIINKYS